MCWWSYVHFQQKQNLELRSTGRTSVGFGCIPERGRDAQIMHNPHYISKVKWTDIRYMDSHIMKGVMSSTFTTHYAGWQQDLTFENETRY